MGWGEEVSVSSLFALLQYQSVLLMCDMYSVLSVRYIVHGVPFPHRLQYECVHVCVCVNCL